MRTSRRGFFATLLALPALLKAKPEPVKEVRLAYTDTDSMVVNFKGPWTDKEKRLVFKLYQNTLYGKFASGPHWPQVKIVAV